MITCYKSVSRFLTGSATVGSGDTKSPRAGHVAVEASVILESATLEAARAASKVVKQRTVKVIQSEPTWHVF